MSALEGDGPCMDCGGDNIIWFAPNVIWNTVMGPPGCLDDPGGIVCIPCFAVRASKVIAPSAWRLEPEWPWRYAADRPEEYR